jgi:hypothetical protein
MGVSGIASSIFLLLRIKPMEGGASETLVLGVPEKGQFFGQLHRFVIAFVTISA